MANVINSFVLSFGRDTGKLRQAISQTEAHINAVLNIIAQFANGVDEELQEAGGNFESIAAKTQPAGNAVQAAATAASGTLEKMLTEVDKTGRSTNQLEDNANKFGKSFGGKMNGFLKDVVDPIGGLLTNDAFANSCFSDLEKLTELSQKAILSIQELLEKQNLLNVYNEEELERYSQPQKRLETFNKTMSQGAIMHFAFPALIFAGDKISLLFNGLKNAAQTCFSYFNDAIEPLPNIFNNAPKLITAIYADNFDEAIKHFKNPLLSIGKFIFPAVTGGFNLVYDVANGPFNGTANSIIGWLNGKSKTIIEHVPDFLIEWVNSVDEAVTESGQNMVNTVAPNMAGAIGNAALSVVNSALASPSTVDNSSATNIGTITINTQATDAQGIAKGIGGALPRALVNTQNTGVGQ